MIKLLALDLDGTVLTKNKQLTDKTKTAIRSAAESGIEIVFVTGRPFHGLPQELSALSGCYRYVITSNGAITSDLKTGDYLRTAFLKNSLAEGILQLTLEHDLLYNIFIDGLGFSHKEMYEKEQALFSGTVSETYVRQSRRPSEDIHALVKAPSSNIENFWIRAKHQEERDAINETILKYRDLQTVLTANTDIEVSAPDADKGIALKSLAQSLNIPKEEVMAIGDNENDLSMFAAAGISVAMGNSSDFVKSQASHITLSNEENGVAEAVFRYT